MHSAPLLRTRRTGLFLVDTQTFLTDAHVVHQLVDFADSLGLVSHMWMSYPLSLRNGLRLRRGTVPANVWHTLCGCSFFAAHPANSFHRIDRSEVERTNPRVMCDFILNEVPTGGLKWVTACPSTAPHFHPPMANGVKHQLWVPIQLRRLVPIHAEVHVTLPPFETFVHVEQLTPDAKLAEIVDKLCWT
ncbi:hypothetical protein IOCL2690_000709000 [Leishmania lindenbergi]|uniref:Uncharacterized protein n=1 Tax=Leishmania lindenbergi TaxID=651832 RepID=A0AAW2ZX11_9TRYP